MSVSLDDRAHAASAALRTEAELRPATEPSVNGRAPARVVLTAVVLVVALTVGVFFAVRAASPRKGGAASQPSGRYEASATLLAVKTRVGHPSSASATQSARSLRIGIVPNRVATQLHYHGTSEQLAAQIHTTVNEKAGTITISSVQPTAARAVAVVNAFAEQLVRYLAQVARISYNAAVNKAIDLTQSLSRQRSSALAALAGDPNNAALKTRAQGLESAYSNAIKAYAKVVSSGVPDRPLRLVEADDARRLDSPGHGHSHRGVAVALAVIALVLLGGALGFGLGRHRTTART